MKVSAPTLPSLASLSLPPADGASEGTRSNWRGRGPERRGGPWLVPHSQFYLHSLVWTKQQPWRFTFLHFPTVLCYSIPLTSRCPFQLGFWPSVPIVMSCCDALGRNECLPQASGPALLPVLRCCAAPCRESLRLRSRYSHPARTSETAYRP